MPRGIPFIIGNEAAERFSFYGMRSILVVFMTTYLLDATGNDATMTDEAAKGVFHLFVAAAYFTPMLGALISDIFFGKYWTILTISLLYCLGHGLLALMDLGPVLGEHGYAGWDMQPFLFSGLFLIALGAGGIKPCVSAHVGDQFGAGNKHLMTQVFNWFYFSINTGAAASQLATPWLLAEFGPAWAFGIPGILMAIATFVFWLGRNSFVHVPPAGLKKFTEETFSKDGVRALLNLSPLFLLFVPMFWAIFDQTGSAWVIQAEQLDRDFLGIKWLPSSIQAVNPVMILCGIPIFTYIIYPLMGKLFKVTPLRKIGVGLFLTAGSFAVSALIQQPLDAKQADVAEQMYADLGASIRATTDAESEYTASVARTVVAIAEGKLESEQLSELLSTRIATLVPMISEVRFRGLLPSELEQSLLKEAGVDDVRTALIAGAVAGWDDATFEGYGLTYSGAVKAVPDDMLADAVPLAASARVVDALGAREMRSLAYAVKIARSAWLDANGKPDENKVLTYLDNMPSVGWQFLAYLILTSAEILVSIVCLEFAYSQSPRKMKSFVMGVYFLGVSLGNVFVSAVNFVLEAFKDENGNSLLDGANYYWFFTIAMLLVSVVFVFWSQTYKGETFIQGDDDEDTIEAQAEAEGTEVR